MSKFNNCFKQLITESQKIPIAYMSPKIVQKFIFGKYDTTSGRPGYIHPFNLTLLSPVTRRNIEELIQTGWIFDTIIISPVLQWEDQYAFSFVIVGKDNSGQPVVWNRKETQGQGAGQSYIEWQDHKMKATHYLSSEQHISALRKPKKKQTQTKSTPIPAGYIDFNQFHNEFRKEVLKQKVEDAFASGNTEEIANTLTEVI